MTSLFLNTRRGAATLLFTVTMLVLSTMVILFATNFAVMQYKTAANLNRNTQAYEAAEAGLEFGITYLQQNSATILASPSGGYILPYSNASTTNVVLANNSKFSISYTNPVANNYTLIKITSTGTSDDGSSTRVVSQLVGFGSILANIPSTPLTTKGDVTMGGNATIRNTNSNTTVQSAGQVDISGSAKTVLSSGTSSTAAQIKSDVQQSVSSLQSISTSDFFATYFGVPAATVKNNMEHYYSNSSDKNYSSSLSGMSGTSIWIDQTGGTATINGITVIGSSTNPVVMVVNGDLSMRGIVVIYGFVYVVGDSSSTDILGSVTINGALVTQSDLKLTGNVTVNYDATALGNVKNQTALTYYAKVPGSWKDF